MPKEYTKRIGSTTRHTKLILPKSNLSPNRRERYAKITFQKSMVAENIRYNTLNVIPSGLVVRGGGINTYRSEVLQNHASVGISVYPQAIRNPLNFPFAPKYLPTTQNNPTLTKYVRPAALESTIN
jgi:hypothetical protein